MTSRFSTRRATACYPNAGPDLWHLDAPASPIRSSDPRSRSWAACLAAAVPWLALLALVGGTGASPLTAAEGAVGAFLAHGDVGNVGKPGTAAFDAASKAYTVTGGGENMWFTNDALHFVWIQLSGDVTLTADVEFVGTGGNAHRKACLLLRQGLEPDAAYADAALHGDGLTSLQYREERGALTREIQANVTGPRTLRIERYGDEVAMSVARPGDALHPAGGSFKLRLLDPVYVGLGVCAHDNSRLETALFSNVKLESRPHVATTNLLQQCTLETVAIASKDRRAVYQTSNHIEAPNWSRDGRHFLFNSRGRIYRLPATGGTPEPLDTGFATRCNNDHGLSPDGTLLAISDQSQPGGRSLIYVLPAAGGTPRRVTLLGPSYWHGWSPDGKTLAYCAERDGEFDIYTIPAEGGKETRLTEAKGLDDGPDYSADGRWIYFNSERTGRMQIWRMHPDGSAQEQVTHDEWNHWFPHPSPDGKWIVFLTYARDVQGHPERKDVELRLMPAGGGPVEVLARLFGGQGTINVPSWSPDSRQVAFVSYRLVPAEPPLNR